MMQRTFVGLIALGLVATTACSSAQKRNTALGAGLGAAAGAAIGHQSGNTVEGAVIGGAVGGTAGYILTDD